MGIADKLLRSLRDDRPSGKPLRFVFDPRYARPITGVPMDPHRGENIAAFLTIEKLITSDALIAVESASMASLRRVHSDSYLESLADPLTLSHVFGMDFDPAVVDAVVGAHRLMVGGTSRATRVAVQRKATVVHLGGGFHHAAPDRGHGFCLLNDIAVAIRGARAHGVTGPVLVIDVDVHDGDGTRVCFADDPTVHTYSIHNRSLDGPTGGSSRPPRRRRSDSPRGSRCRRCRPPEGTRYNGHFQTQTISRANEQRASLAAPMDRAPDPKKLGQSDEATRSGMDAPPIGYGASGI